MTHQTIDVYAHTNPAYGAILIREYLRGVEHIVRDGVDFPLLLLPLPIAMSGQLAESFDGTNVATGLLAWLQRSPNIKILLPDVVRKTTFYSQRSALLGLTSGVITVDSVARFRSGAKGILQEPLKAYAASDERGQALRRAQRLGHWCGRVGSLESIFNMMGFTL